jgi:hypothetical protein
MKIISNLIKVRGQHSRAIIFFFLLINLLSFISMFYSFYVSFIFFIISIIYLFLNASNLVLSLCNDSARWFLFYLIAEVLSLLNILTLSYSRKIIFIHPELLLSGLSYILVPQILFFYLGYNLSTKPKSEQELIKKNLILIFGGAFFLGLFLHFNRPDFFTIFLERIFLSEVGTGYIGFYPRMTIYWNSMIVGVLGVCFFWITIFQTGLSIMYKWLFGSIFFLGALLSAQRGAWLAFGFSSLLFFFLRFSLKRFLVIISFSLSFTLLFMLLLSYFPEFDSFGSFVDIVNRFDSFGEAFSERRSQYDNFIYIIQNYPFGVGLGLLSHKAADIGLSLTTPDGNYYRIFGELGIFGAIAFIGLIVSSVTKALNGFKQIGLIVCAIFIVQAFGTNVFDLYAAGFLFWFFLGWLNGGVKTNHLPQTIN